MLRFVSSLPLGAAAHSHCCISRHKTHYRLCNTIRLLHLYFVSHGDNPPFVSEEWMSICYNYFPCIRSYFTAVFWSPLLPRNKCGVLSFHRSSFILSDENKRKNELHRVMARTKCLFFQFGTAEFPATLAPPLKTPRWKGALLQARHSMMWDKKDDRKKRCRQHPVWGARCGSASNKMTWRLTCCGTVFLSSRHHSIILPLSFFICIMYFRAYLVIFKFWISVLRVVLPQYLNLK